MSDIEYSVIKIDVIKSFDCTFDAFRVPVRLTYPISVIIYCISEVFIITKYYGKLQYSE